MCTAVYFERGNIFGRTLDLECSLGESVFSVPRDFPLVYKNIGREEHHFAFVGMAYLSDGYPLFYDGVNEHGVAVAGLNFPGCARYCKPKAGCTNLASFEIIQYILSRADTLGRAEELLRSVRVTDEAFGEGLQPTPLHFIISSKDGTLVLEPREGGLVLTKSSHGVLSNAPELSYHTTRASDYFALSPSHGENRLAPNTELSVYSRGLGAFGLPGDFSSSSRYVRALFMKSHTLIEEPYGERERLSAFFHIMDTVSVPLGCVVTDGGAPVSTVYTSAMDLDKLIYYYKTYGGTLRSVALPRA